MKVNQVKDGKTVSTPATRPDATANPNSYTTTAKLTPDDDIRYSWNSFFIDLKNVGATPKASNGYLKVYAGTAAKEEAFITNAGQNLPIRNIKDKLTEGQNTILFQLVSNDGKPVTPTTEVTFSFDFTSASILPSVKVTSPKDGAILSGTAVQDFKIETPNFTLENNATLKQGSGRLTVYWDEVKDDKLVGTVYKNEFRSDELDFAKIPDGKDRKLIFVLRDNKNNPLNPSAEASLTVRTNYQNTIDIGIPRITIVLPNKADKDIALNEYDKIAVKVENFNLVDNTADNNPEDGKGVLQVSLDGKKVGENLTKTEFTLADLNIGTLEKGQKELKVELVQKNFEKLSPEAIDTLKFQYEPKLTANTSTQATDTTTDEVQNPAWKVIIVILVVILIIGGIAVLITKA
ncbi:MAG: hypothetical protein OHK0017_04470 [Patescibacteria group bacterium]